MKTILRILALGVLTSAWGGVEVNYQLPVDGKTYRVTLAIVEAKNPNWIISQFVCGQPHAGTAENKGRFTETWDGLDDNFMPVPPGTYGVKGICMPAAKWPVDGEYHSITPRFVGGPSAWLPTPEQWNIPEPFGGDPCDAPLADVDVGPNGHAVFYYAYLENGLNNPIFDLNKPVGLGQFQRAYGSGGAAGGDSTCTDGETVWSFCNEGGDKYVYRPDGKHFGSAHLQRPNVYRPDGWVTAMAAWRDQAAGKSYVYVAQRGKIVEQGRRYLESDKEFVDKITVHDGETGMVLKEIPVRRPRGLVARSGTVHILHETATGGWAVSEYADNLRPLFAVPATIHPVDLEEDSHGRFYLSDPAANKVWQLDHAGKILRAYGRLDAQVPGTYDPLTLMAPGKLAVWTDPAGNDRLIIVERAGPNRASEWSADGKLLREFQSLQTKANDGYTVDPEHPEDVYIAGHQGWLTRFKVDYATGQWTVNAVWPDIGTDPVAPGFDHPQFIRWQGRAYLACARNYTVYRLDGDRWRLAAAIIRKRVDNHQQCWLWHDVNGDGKVQPDEYQATPLELPGWLLRYHGEQWLDDLSLLALNQRGNDLWRLAPTGADEHGNPIFGKWEKVLTDPVFAARTAGTADAVHGGNELDDKFSSDWAMAAGSVADGFYVNARGGKNFSANDGAQVKISRYAPDGQGGFKLQWRTGRAALQHVAQAGEIYSAIHLHPPINGLLSVVDQSRCGIALFTADGLYVDTLFPDGRRVAHDQAGIYPQPGEFFAGFIYPNRDNGQIYFGMGKYSPLLFTAQGWSVRENPVRPLPELQKTVTILAAEIARPPEIALSVRGGAGQTQVARFAPALGGAVLDGSLDGWESCAPVRFQGDTNQTVEVRALYDAGHLYLRWHARLGRPVAPKALQPIERIFTHDRLADTLSFYIQGDPAAKPNGPAGGRPGDARIVFGIFQNGTNQVPVALGLYPKWPGPGQPVTYQTPVGRVDYAHVGPVAGVELHHVIDPDGQGFVLVAGIPRTALPGLPVLTDSVRTLVDFEATFAGHNKFWWANSDGSASHETYDEPTEARLYPGAWAPVQFESVDHGIVARHWQVCGPFGGPGASQFMYDLRGTLPGTNKDYKQAGTEFCEAGKYPPDNDVVDTNEVFTGEMIRGYWHDPRAVRWTPAALAELDTRVVLGGAAQVWYGATWVYAPAETEVDFQFQSHPQTVLRWTLNGQAIVVAPKEYKSTGDGLRLVASKLLRLRAGWNQVLFRGYCVGYSPFRVGLVLAGPPEKLWTLRLSGQLHE